MVNFLVPPIRNGIRNHFPTRHWKFLYIYIYCSKMKTSSKNVRGKYKCFNLLLTYSVRRNLKSVDQLLCTLNGKNNR